MTLIVSAQEVKQIKGRKRAKETASRGRQTNYIKELVILCLDVLIIYAVAVLLTMVS